MVSAPTTTDKDFEMMTQASTSSYIQNFKCTGLISRPGNSDLGCVKSWENGKYKITGFGDSVEMQRVVGSFYNHANLSEVTKPQSTLLRHIDHPNW